MPIPSDFPISDLERAKFLYDALRGWVVKTDTEVTGEVIPTGLKTGGKVTNVSLDDTQWTALPSTPLANRNNITVQNQSDNGNVILWNYSASAPGTEGFRIEDGGFKSVPLTDAVIVYGRMLSGSGVASVDEIA